MTDEKSKGAIEVALDRLQELELAAGTDDPARPLALAAALAELAALREVVKAADALIGVLRPNDHAPEDGPDPFWPALTDYRAARSRLT